MRMVFETSELKRTVKVLEKVNKSKENPYIRFRNTGEGFIIGTSDGAVTLEKEINIDFDGDRVDFQINKNVFTGLVKGSNSKEVVLEKDEHGILFKSGKTKVKLPYSDEIIKYVDTSDAERNNVFELNSESVLSGLNKVVYAADFNGGDIKYGSVLWHFKPDAISFVATDRFRLAYSEIGNDSGVEDIKFLFPVFPLETFKYLLKETEADTVCVYYQGNKLYLFIAELVFCVLLPGLEPFDYEKVINPNNQKCKVVAERGELLRNLGLSEVISESRIGEKAANIKFNEGIHIVLNTENGVLESNTEANVKGEFVLDKTGFYPSNISDVLKRADTDYVFIDLEDSNTPMVISEDGEVNWKALVMPVALEAGA